MRNRKEGAQVLTHPLRRFMMPKKICLLTTGGTITMIHDTQQGDCARHIPT
ncbi:MAG UNVERIFIED_CONTAM: hypothetical protein LVT10_06295 [Anaerolineae bacterium]